MAWVSVTAKELVHVEEGNLLPAANTRDNELSEKGKLKRTNQLIIGIDCDVVKVGRIVVH